VNPSPERQKKYNPSVAPYAPGEYKFGNAELPFAYYRRDFDPFIASIRELDVPVGMVAGPTGSGKTTTVPQAVYESDLFNKTYVSVGKIFLAREAYERCVAEMAQVIGPDAARRKVGYATSTEGALHEDNKIVFATHGYMSQKMHHEGDRMAGRDLYIADEYHERDKEGDVSVEVAKMYNINTLLMSATLDIDRFAKHHTSYDGFTPAPVFQVEGRQFAIENRTMEYSTEAAAWAIENGLDTLYNLPGVAEIDAEIGRISRMTKAPFIALPLHGEQSAAEQRRATQRYDKTKLILGSKIVDSGVTLSVDVVVDPQLERTVELRNGVETLTTRRTSIATSLQRAGRAGRDKDGIYITGRYPDAPPILYEKDQAEFSRPEILDNRVDGIVLRLAQSNHTIERINLMDKPSDKEIERTSHRLRNLGAFSLDNSLTELGMEMAHLSLHPSLARMVVKSREYSQDVHRFMTIGAVVQQVGGVGMRMKDKESWRQLSKDKKSDLLRDLDVFLRARTMTDAECDKFNIVDQRMHKVEVQLASLLRREGLEEMSENRLASEIERQQLLECIVAGSEEVYFHRTQKTYKDMSRRQNRRIAHNSSVATTRMVLGQPWNQEEMRPKTMVVNQGRRIKNAISVDAELLKRAAPERCSYRDVDFELEEDGSIVAVRELLFDDQPTRDMTKGPLQESTPELRQFVINGLFQEVLRNEEALPDNLKAFRGEVVKLRQYEHRALEEIGVEEILRIIQSEINDIIPEHAWTLEEIMQYADANFIHGFMTNEQRRKIEQQSPAHIIVTGNDGRNINVSVEYINHDAEIYVIDFDDVRNLPPFIPELDGRMIMVRVESSGKVESLQVVTSGKYAGSREQRRGGRVLQAMGFASQRTMPPSAALSNARTFNARKK
jgi:HrpA-like RNA helicase